MRQNIAIALSGNGQFPSGVTTRSVGSVVLPAVLASPVDAAIELVLTSPQKIGGWSFTVLTGLLSPTGEYAPVALVQDEIQDVSAPALLQHTKKLTFEGGALPDAAAGELLFIEVVRFGGCGRLQTEADAVLQAAYLQVSVPETAGLSAGDVMSRISLRV